MANTNPFEQLLEKTAQYLSGRIAAVEHSFSILSSKLRAACVRVGRSAWESLRSGVRNLRYLLALFSIFLALVWIGSGFFELTFYESWQLKVIGWSGSTFIAIVILIGFVTLFFPAPKDFSLSHTLTVRYLMVNIVAVMALGGAMHLGYEFRSPILRRAANSMIYITDRFPRRGIGDFRSASDPTQSRIQSQPIPDHPWFGKQSQLTSSSPTVIRVECKKEDKNWVSSDGNIPLNMWVEGMSLTDRATTLDVAVKGWYTSGATSLDAATGAYLVDDAGQVYLLDTDFGDYGFFSNQRSVVGDEIYRFKLKFPKLDHHSGNIRFHHPQFRDHVIDLFPCW